MTAYEGGTSMTTPSKTPDTSGAEALPLASAPGQDPGAAEDSKAAAAPAPKRAPRPRKAIAAAPEPPAGEQAPAEPETPPEPPWEPLQFDTPPDGWHRRHPLIGARLARQAPRVFEPMGDMACPPVLTEELDACFGHSVVTIRSDYKKSRGRTHEAFDRVHEQVHAGRYIRGSKCWQKAAYKNHVPTLNGVAEISHA